MRKYILDKIKQMLKRSFFFYILLSLCLFIAVGELEHAVNVYYEGSWGMQGRKLLDAMLLAFPALLLKKKRFLFPYLLLVNLYLLSIICYFRTYETIMPLSSYLLFDNLKGLEDSILHSFHAVDCLIVAPTFVFICVYTYMYDMIKTTFSARGALLLLLFLALLISVPYWPNKRVFYKQPLYLFNIVGPRAFKEYGIVNYWIYQFSLWRGVSDSEEEYACAFMDELAERPVLECPDSLKTENKNLIVILVESLQSWPIGLKVDGVEVTPCLNKLVGMRDNVYLPKVLSQVKDGRSNDAQLLINTGLLPLNVGAVSSLCASNVFPSLPKALSTHGYTSASFICDEKNFWNQGMTTASYGFDNLYDRIQGKSDKVDADKKLFEYALSHLIGLNKPFYAQLVTISTHEPYLEPQLPGSPLMKGIFADDEVRNYLISVQLLDERIAGFLNGLKEVGLYDNSVIVIIGDHEQMTYNRYVGREQQKVEDCFVPFIILNSPLQATQVDKVVGQVDIYPSLLQVMGCCDYSFQGLGESVFGDSLSDYAVFRTGVATGGANVPDSVKMHRTKLWEVSDILLRMDYFRSLLLY